MVRRTRLNLTLYAHLLSCFFSMNIQTRTLLCNIETYVKNFKDQFIKKSEERQEYFDTLHIHMNN